MTTYPKAFYVNVLDGVPGLLQFASVGANHTFVPAQGYVTPADQTLSTNFGSVGAVLDVSASAPAGSGGSWQGAVSSVSYDSNAKQVNVNFNGTLPAMNAGVYPCGWLLREHAWQVEAVNGASLALYGFTDANDGVDANGIPQNQFPVYFVPFFGNYGAGKGVGDPSFSVSGGVAGVGGYSDAVVTLTFPKPLNPLQTLSNMSWVVQNVASGSAQAMPAPVHSAITAAEVKNAYGQVTALQFTIPLSLLSLGAATPGTVYNFAVSVTMPLTFLTTSSYGPSTVTIATGSCSITLQDEATGPTVSNVVLAPSTASNAYGKAGGLHYVSPYFNADIFGGDVVVTYNAADVWGINSAAAELTVPAGGSVIANSGTNVGANSGAFTSLFNTRGLGTSHNGPVNNVNAFLVVPNQDPYGVLRSSMMSALPANYTHSTIYFANINNFRSDDATKGVSVRSYDMSTACTLGSANGYNGYVDAGFVVWDLPIPPAFIDYVQCVVKNARTGNLVAGCWSGDLPDLAPGSFTISTKNRFGEDILFPGWMVNLGDRARFGVPVTDYTHIVQVEGPPGTWHTLGEAMEMGYANSYAFTVVDKAGYTYTMTTDISIASFSTSGQGVGCVPEDALITMADGSTQPLKDLRVGDELLTVDPISLERVAKKIALIVPMGVQPCVVVTFSDGSKRTMSESHRVAIGSQYFEAKSLIPGMSATTVSGKVVVESVEEVEPMAVWTISIDDLVCRNYFADGILAHNKTVEDCVVAGTPVLMADGTEKAIETVLPGEMVVSFNQITGAHEQATVLSTFTTKTDRLYTLQFEGGRTLTCTPTHVLFTGYGWKTVDAYVGCEDQPKVLMQDGTYQHLKSATRIPLPSPVDVYLLEVEGNHTLFVGGVACHNTKTMTV